MNKEKFSLSEYGDTIKEVLESGGEFRIYPSGTSMLPILREGADSVSVSKPAQFLKAGDIAFYQRENGAYILHRVIKAENDTYVMCGDNQITLENGISHKNIVGIVTKIYRSDKLFNTKGFGYKFYLILWKCFFIRRIYFKLRNIFKGVNK